MSQSSSSSSSFSSSSSGKCGYNKHFPRSFLLNYSAALQDPKEEAILKRVHDFNCEWLQRPNIAISELAQTLRENLPLLQQYSGTIFMPDFVDDLASRLEPPKDVLSRLDNKDKSTSQPASRERCRVPLADHGQPEVEDFVVEGLNAASPLFMVCVHLLVPMTLMRNPEEFAEKGRRTPQNAAFKEDPSPRQMRDFILDSITKRRRPTSSGSIWDSVDDQDEEEAEPGPSRRRASHGRRRSQSSTPLPSLWEQEDAPVVDNEPQRQMPSTQSPHVSRKRRHSSTPASSTPPSSQEVLTQWHPLPGPAATKWKRTLQPPRTSTPIPRAKPARIRGAALSPSTSSSSGVLSSSDEEPAPEKQAQKPPAKAMNSKGKTAAQAVKETPAAAKTTVSGSKGAAKKLSSSSLSSSDSSSDEAPAGKKSPNKTPASTASSSSANPGSNSKAPNSTWHIDFFCKS